MFDTDDALDLVPPENLNYAAVQTGWSCITVLLSAADVVTTTTETLAAYLRRSIRNVVVVPNSVDPEEWTVQPRNDGVRVGWTGSPTHFADLAVALDAIRELQKKHRFHVRAARNLHGADARGALRRPAGATHGKTLF